MQSVPHLEKLAVALGGMPVWGALPDSPAARAGLRYGDVLLRLNGHAIRTPGDFLRATDGAPRVWAVEVFRDGAALELTVQLEAELEVPSAASLSMRMAEAGLPGAR